VLEDAECDDSERPDSDRPLFAQETIAEASCDISERLSSLTDDEPSDERTNALETARAILEIELSPDSADEMARLCSLISSLDDSSRLEDPIVSSCTARDNSLANDPCSDDPERERTEARADSSPIELSDERDDSDCELERIDSNLEANWLAIRDWVWEPAGTSAAVESAMVIAAATLLWRD